MTSVSGLSNWWLQGPLTDMGKTGVGVKLGKDYPNSSSVSSCLHQNMFKN